MEEFQRLFAEYVAGSMVDFRTLKQIAEELHHQGHTSWQINAILVIHYLETKDCNRAISAMLAVMSENPQCNVPFLPNQAILAEMPRDVQDSSAYYSHLQKAVEKVISAHIESSSLVKHSRKLRTTRVSRSQIAMLLDSRVADADLDIVIFAICGMYAKKFKTWPLSGIVIRRGLTIEVCDCPAYPDVPEEFLHRLRTVIDAVLRMNVPRLHTALLKEPLHFRTHDGCVIDADRACSWFQESDTMLEQ